MGRRSRSGAFTNYTTIETREKVKEIHNNFVRGLYNYRSDIIHRTPEILETQYSHELISNKKTITFLCSKTQQKKFKDIGDLDKKYTVTYFVEYLIIKTIESIASLLLVLKKFIEENSNHEKLLKEGKIMFAYVDKSKQLISPSQPYWSEFYTIFNDQY